MLDLVAVDKLLFEKAELIVDAVADGGQIESSERVEETRGETAETAVAETHVHFALTHGLPIDAKILQCTARFVVEAGVVEIVLEQTTHEIFEREIVEAADVLFVVDALGLDKTGEDLLTHGERGGDPPVARFGGLQIARKREGEIAQDGLLEITAPRHSIDLRRNDLGGCGFRFFLLRFGK